MVRIWKLTKLLLSDYDWASIFSWLFWFAFIAFILYNLFFSSRDNTGAGNSRSTRPSRNTRPSGGSGWFPGDYHDNQSGPPPPPYSKNPGNTGWQNWRPGFWTGAAVGGLANQMWNRARTAAPVPPTAYDWERSQSRSSPSFFQRGSSYSQPAPFNNDRGEGSSNLGPMRRSTGLGGSTVR